MGLGLLGGRLAVGQYVVNTEYSSYFLLTPHSYPSNVVSACVYSNSKLVG